MRVVKKVESVDIWGGLQEVQGLVNLVSRSRGQEMGRPVALSPGHQDKDGGSLGRTGASATF